MRSYKIIATTKNSRNLSKAPYSPNKRCLIIKPTINRYTIFFLGLILHPSGPGGCLFQDGPFYECSDSQAGPLPENPHCYSGGLRLSHFNPQRLVACGAVGKDAARDGADD